MEFCVLGFPNSKNMNFCVCIMTMYRYVTQNRVHIPGIKLLNRSCLYSKQEVFGMTYHSSLSSYKVLTPTRKWPILFSETVSKVRI